MYPTTPTLSTKLAPSMGILRNVLSKADWRISASNPDNADQLFRDLSGNGNDAQNGSVRGALIWDGAIVGIGDTSSDMLSVPYSTDFQPTRSIEVIMSMTADDWSSPGVGAYLFQYGQTSGNYVMDFYRNSANTNIVIQGSHDGTTRVLRQASLLRNNGVRVWWKIKFTDQGGSVFLQAWDSLDGVDYTPRFSNDMPATMTSIFGSSAESFEFCPGVQDGLVLHYASVTVDDVLVCEVDPSRESNGTTSFTDGVKAKIDGGVLSLPGTSGNRATILDDTSFAIGTNVAVWTIQSNGTTPVWSGAYNNAHICGQHGSIDGEKSAAVWLQMVGGELRPLVRYRQSSNKTVVCGAEWDPTTYPWLRVTMDPPNQTIDFERSVDGSIWTALGPQQVMDSALAVHDPASAPDWSIGGDTNDAYSVDWGILSVEHVIGGTTVVDANFSDQTDGTTSFIDGVGNTVTVNQSSNTIIVNSKGSDVNDALRHSPDKLEDGGFVVLGGGTPERLALTSTNLQGDIVAAGWFYLSDWADGAAQGFMSQFAGPTNKGFVVKKLTSNVLRFIGSVDGSTEFNVDSDSVAGLSAGWHYWEVSRNATTGAVAFEVDGADYGGGTSTTGNLFASTAGMEVGRGDAGTYMVGRIRSASFISGETIRVDIDIDRDAPRSGVTSFMAGTGGLVTVHDSGSGYGCRVIKKARIHGDGVDDYVGLTDNALFDLDLTSPIVVAAVFDVPPAQATAKPIVAKTDFFSAGWALYLDSSGKPSFGVIGGAASVLTAASALTPGTLAVLVAMRDITNDQLRLWVNGVEETPITDATVSSPAYAGPVRLMASNSIYSRVCLSEVVIVEDELSSAEVVSLSAKLGLNA